jgi:hypothetical protein
MLETFNIRKGGKEEIIEKEKAGKKIESQEESVRKQKVRTLY